MRLDFKALWVEDQPNAVKDQSEAIAEGMAEDGFEFRPTMCRTLDEVKGLLADEVFNDEIDLILVDWDLGGGMEGQDAIVTIREDVPYKDVVFYSANNDVAELRKLAVAAGVEGVYCATRSYLVQEVLGVFQSLVKKVLDLDHSRGIVMGATSDIDRMVLEAVQAINGKFKGADQKALVAEALAIIDARVADHSKKLEKLRADGSMAALLKAHLIFTANDRLHILSRLLEKDALKAHAGRRVHVTKYMRDVVPKRNDMGHKVLLPGGKTLAIASIEGAKDMSLEEVRDLRRTILELRGEFRSLLDALPK
jgi:DNA-binding NarL/FixJ family response regulator